MATTGRRIRRPPITPTAAAWLSALLPGWGQVRQGRLPAARPYLRVALILGVVGLLSLAAGPAEIAKWLADPGHLLLLLLANVVIAALRTMAAWEAWRGGGGSLRRAGLVAVLAFVLIPHAALGWGQVRTYNFLTTVFSGGGLTPEFALGGSTSTSAATPGTEGTATTATTVAPTTTTTVPWEGRGRLNLMLLGADSGVGRSGIRTDTMIVASINLVDGDIAMFGFPRNLTNLRFPDGTDFTAYSHILNEVYPFGLDNPDRYPGSSNPGAAALSDMLEGITGIDIDYYVMVNLQAFVDIVNALGGVEIFIPRTIVDDNYPLEDGTFTSITIEEGVQSLDGTEALAYVRSRNDSNDYDRMGRQRCFLAAMAAQADPTSILTSLPSLLDTIQNNVATDLPVSALPSLIELLPDVKPTEALVIGFGPPDWISGRDGGYPIPDVTKIQSAVALAIEDPAQARLDFGVEEAGDACGYGDDPTSAPTTTTAPTPTTTGSTITEP
ncbi:MAG TPA: LCP family protein [Acidimicrobiia bacterium]|nr:LCP family protein [Acidimicrobiia bacterium]